MIRDIARYVVLGGIFLLPFLPLVVANSLFFPFITGKNFAFRIIVEIIFAAWVILACYDRDYRPRFSYILVAILSFLGIMALADAFGVSPHKSFWSNYERMEGYVTLLHLGLYFIVAGSVLAREKLWGAFWNVSLFVATLMMFYGFCQLSGSASCPISQSDFRIDGRMGNAAYLAIYMFFHVFIALILFVRSTSQNLRITYGLLALGFVYTLAMTGTRGTTLALFGGAFLTAAYIALFERNNMLVRKIAAGGVLIVIVVAGALYSAKDAAFIKESTVLSRLASVSLQEGATRFTIWELAWQGVKERPILGWGQENFNYVFNEHYEAKLYSQEAWFDRVHNIVFDWLIAGGILGFLAYFSIIFTALYYAVIRPFFTAGEYPLSVAERGLLLGLIGGYVAHNLLVFDNLISYFFFMSVIAMLHGTFATDIKKITAARIESHHITNIVMPVVALALAGALYVVNVPAIAGAHSIIIALQSPSPEVQLAAYKDAIGTGTYALQEVREQLVRSAQQALQDTSLAEQYVRQGMSPQEAEAQAEAVRQSFFELADTEMTRQLEETPDDVRILMFQGMVYRAAGRHQDALAILSRAHELSPEKQQIYFEMALARSELGDMAGAHQTFAEAYALEPRNPHARILYALSALTVGDRALFDELITPEYEDLYVSDPTVLTTAYQHKQYDIVEDILLKRIERSPEDIQLRATLAFTYFEAGDRVRAVTVLREAIEDFPQFKAEGERYIKQVETGPAPTR